MSHSKLHLDWRSSWLQSAADCTLATPSVLNKATLMIQLLCDSCKVSRGLENFCYNLDILVVEEG